MVEEHKFYLVSYDEFEEEGYDGTYPILEDLSNIVLIHDDMIQYMQDTFSWIPSINPGMGYEKRFGLCNYGITLFDKAGAEVISRLAKAWADLFSNGTTTLILTGNYGSIATENGIQQEGYAVLEVDRDEIVRNLRKLQLFSEKVIAGNYFILHYGL
jgi:hypothetical protein